MTEYRRFAPHELPGATHVTINVTEKKSEKATTKCKKRNKDPEFGESFLKFSLFSTV